MRHRLSTGGNFRDRDYSITLGTPKNPCSAAGALASTSSRRPPAVSGIDHIVAQPHGLRDHGGHRLDLGGIDLAQLLDPAQDIVEFGDHAIQLRLIHTDAREAGDLGHFFAGD